MKKIHIESVQDLYSLYQLGKPKHDLITVFKVRPHSESVKLSEIEFSSDLYYITLKNGYSGSMSYGRTSYDFYDGTMIFIGPGQSAVFNSQSDSPKSEGWTILFHPDLIRKSSLGKTIRNFDFFNYAQSEALHLSVEELNYMNILVDKVSEELEPQGDNHSQAIILQHLETFLMYCDRYYERQFQTRTPLNSDLVIRFESYLSEYFKSEALEIKGLPTVEGCGVKLGLSGAYLSAMLKTQTEKSAKEHIYDYFIDYAKTAIISSDQTISEIAYKFGFEYPQHFSKLFKLKTGLSPSEYRLSKSF